MLQNLHRFKPAIVVGAVATMFLTSCKDENYDLSDIDDTIRLEVKDLVVPLNLEPVRFESLITLSDEECVKVIDGKYTFVKDGSLTSDINIKKIDVYPKLNTQPEAIPVPLVNGVGTDIPACSQSFTYEENNVDKYIRTIDNVKVDFNIGISFDLTTKVNGVDKGVGCTFSNLKLRMPKGLYGECVETGQKIDAGVEPVLDLSKNYETNDGHVSFTYHVTEINANDAEVKFDGVNHHFDYTGAVGVDAGHIAVTDASVNGNVGQLKVVFDLGRLEVNELTGIVNYIVDNLNTQNVDLGDLPDVLTDPATRITIKNPQLYMSINNPFATYCSHNDDNSYLSCGLTIKQERESDITAHLAEPIKIPAVKEQSVFCFSPEEPKPMYEPFASALWQKMLNLGNILYGDGIPRGLIVDFGHPTLTNTYVENLPLGKIDGITGTYYFFAPFEFGENSQILYSESQGGWDFGNDDMRINNLSIKAHVVSDLPVAITITGEPLDADGHVLLDLKTGEPLTITGATVPANGEADIELKVNGEFNRIDGMHYSVFLKAGEDKSALRPDMNLTLSDIRATVGGYYQTTLSDDDDDK